MTSAIITEPGHVADGKRVESDESTPAVPKPSGAAPKAKKLMAVDTGFLDAAMNYYNSPSLPSESAENSPMPGLWAADERDDSDDPDPAVPKPSGAAPMAKSDPNEKDDNPMDVSSYDSAMNSQHRTVPVKILPKDDLDVWPESDPPEPYYPDVAKSKFTKEQIWKWYNHRTTPMEKLKFAATSRDWAKFRKIEQEYGRRRAEKIARAVRATPFSDDIGDIAPDLSPEMRKLFEKVKQDDPQAFEKLVTDARIGILVGKDSVLYKMQVADVENTPSWASFAQWEFDMECEYGGVGMACANLALNFGAGFFGTLHKGTLGAVRAVAVEANEAHGGDLDADRQRRQSGTYRDLTPEEYVALAECLPMPPRKDTPLLADEVNWRPNPDDWLSEIVRNTAAFYKTVSENELAKGEVAYHRPEGGIANQMAYGAGALGAFVITGGATGGAAVPALVFGNAKEDSRRALLAAGCDEQVSERYSSLIGVVAAALSCLKVDYFFKSVQKSVPASTLSTLGAAAGVIGKEAGKAAAFNAGVDMTGYAFQSIFMEYAQTQRPGYRGFNLRAFIDKLMPGMLKTGLQSAVVGGLVGGATSAPVRAAGRYYWNRAGRRLFSRGADLFKGDDKLKLPPEQILYLIDDSLEKKGAPRTAYQSAEDVLAAFAGDEAALNGYLEVVKVPREAFDHALRTGADIEIMSAGAIYFYGINQKTMPDFIKTVKLTPGGETFGALMVHEGDTVAVAAELDSIRKENPQRPEAYLQLSKRIEAASGDADLAADFSDVMLATSRVVGKGLGMTPEEFLNLPPIHEAVEQAVRQAQEMGEAAGSIEERGAQAKQTGQAKGVINNMAEADVSARTAELAALPVPERTAQATSTILDTLDNHKDTPGAMLLDGYGLVSFIYGESGNPKRKFRGGFGIAHIYEKRKAEAIAAGKSEQEAEIIARGVVECLPDVIATGKQVPDKYNENRMHVIKDGVTAILSRFDSGGNAGWVLTGWDTALHEKTSSDVPAGVSPGSAYAPGSPSMRMQAGAEEVVYSISDKDGQVKSREATGKVPEDVIREGFADESPSGGEVIELRQEDLSERQRKMQELREEITAKKKKASPGSQGQTEIGSESGSSPQSATPEVVKLELQRMREVSATKRIECASIMDSNGNIIASFEGGEGEVQIPKEVANGPDNSIIITHSHTNNTCFSAEDLQMLCDAKALKEMHVVASDGRSYSISVGNGKRQDADTIMREYRSAGSSAYQIHRENFLQGKFDWQEMVRRHSVETVKIVAERFGWEFKQ